MAAKIKQKQTDAARDLAARQEMAADLDGSAPLPEVYRGSISFVDIPALRRRLGLSQVAFAERFGFAVASLRNWEQARRVPDRSTRILLRVISEDPDRVSRIAASS
jgi:putative transcriptional regulator